MDLSFVMLASFAEKRDCDYAHVTVVRLQCAAQLRVLLIFLIFQGVLLFIVTLPCFSDTVITRAI